MKKLTDAKKRTGMKKSGATKKGAAAKGKMKPRASSPPGLETDGKGAIVPVAKRTPDDRAKVHRASAKRKAKA